MRKTLFLVCAIFLLGGAGAESQAPPETPQVEPQQKPDSGVKRQNGAQSDQPTSSQPMAVPNSQSPPMEGNRKGETREGREEASEFWPPLFGVRVKITDSLLALFTFLLWWSTRSLVVSAEKTAERQLRAYIAVNPTVIRFPLGGFPEADFIIKNTGQTPAYDVRYVAMFEILLHPLLRNQGDLVKYDPSERLPNKAIHSEQHIIGTAKSEYVVGEKDMKELIATPSKRLYLAGIVYYRDIFKKTKTTRFCASITGEDIARGVNQHAIHRAGVPIEWEFSDVLNDAD
jgi:hypothetical protein